MPNATRNPPVGQAVPVILIVDNSLDEQRIVRGILQSNGHYQIVCARDGVEALEVIERSLPAAVLTDMNVPQMNGFTLVETVRARFPLIPVVVMTATGSERTAVAALKAGAADYVPKQALHQELMPVLERVISYGQAEHHRYRVLQGMVRRSSQYVLENDPALVPPLVNQLREDLIEMGLCDTAGSMRAGIALEEALLNALIHGNLEVSSDVRQVSDSAFHEQVEERRHEEPYSSRRVRVAARLTPAQGIFVITDEGPGFDVSQIPDPTSPDSLEKPSGRGVLLMRMFMDEIEYNSTGNRVVMVKRRDASSSAGAVENAHMRAELS